MPSKTTKKGKKELLITQYDIFFNVEEYLNSLPDTITEINLSQKGITYIPDLSRFKNLEGLYCNWNNLTSLPKINYISVEKKNT